MCMLRMRALYNDRGCPICKKELKNVVITDSAEMEFQAYDLKCLPMDKHWHVHFKGQKDLERFGRLRQVRCSECDFVAEGSSMQMRWGRLKDHAKTVHQMSFCSVCLSHRKVFPHEQRLYTASQLQVHMESGDPDDPELFGKGHPQCQFCHQTLYGNDELYKHLREKHFQCTLCEMVGSEYIYFENYSSLFAHFKQKHFVCEHPECLRQKYVVFKDEIDLKAHQATVHQSGNRDVSRELFNMQPRHNLQTNETAHTATLAPPQEPPTLEDFPSLGLSEQQSGAEAPAGQTALVSDWNHRSQAQRGYVHEEAFPTLGSTVSAPQPAPASSGWASRASQPVRQANNRANNSRAVAGVWPAANQSAPATSRQSSVRPAPEDFPALPQPAQRPARVPLNRAAAPTNRDVHVVIPELAQVEGEFINRDADNNGMMNVETAKQRRKDKKMKKKQEQRVTEEDFPTLAPAPAWGAATQQRPQQRPSTQPPRQRAPAPSEPVMPSMPSAPDPPKLQIPASQEELVSRNTRLVSSMKALGRDQSHFNNFKQCSRQFQGGLMTAPQFAAAFWKAFGTSAQSKELMVELISLLPNEIKRGELLKCL